MAWRPPVVRICTLSGELCKIRAKKSWTVADLKEAVQAEAGVPAAEQRLLLADVELLGKDTLPDMPEGLELTLVRRPKAVNQDWLLEIAKAEKLDAERPQWSADVGPPFREILGGPVPPAQGRQPAMQGAMQGGWQQAGDQGQGVPGPWQGPGGPPHSMAPRGHVAAAAPWQPGQVFQPMFQMPGGPGGAHPSGPGGPQGGMPTEAPMAAQGMTMLPMGHMGGQGGQMGTMPQYGYAPVAMPQYGQQGYNMYNPNLAGQTGPPMQHGPQGQMMMGPGGQMMGPGGQMMGPGWPAGGGPGGQGLQQG